MKYVNSNNSISSLVSTHTNTSNNSSFEELVSKLFSCNIVLVLTDNAKQFVRNCFDNVTFASILNQFASIANLHLTIRDLNGHNAYALNKIRFRFFDIDQFKNRPNGTQLKKLHSDIISSMSNAYLMQQNDDDNGDNNFMNETPWYDMWKNVFIDTLEPTEHDFIGTNCGCFFVITKTELPHYKVIFERLCSSVKQNSTLRFIQADFVRYFIVLSDQILDSPLSPNADEFTKTCQNLKLDFPNSFVFYIDVNGVSSSNARPDDPFKSTTDAIGNQIPDVINENIMGDINPTDPLSVVSETNNENSKFYQELQSQRQQSHQQQNNSSTTTPSLQSRDIINDWLSHLSIHDHLKELLDSVSETIDFMLREFISKFLVPWAERQIKILGELIALRRGFRKSLFSATKSLLSNMSSSTVGLSKSLGSSGVIYIPDAQEMQQRKLADICMIFNIYEMAHSLYYGARKDFQSESAWIYYAGASEMSAISSYFLHKYQHNHMEQAITTYLDLCRTVNLATRATILASELLCQLHRYDDAANLYIRMTGDDSDLRSALFLEQASKCYLSVSPKLSLKRSSTSQILLNAIEKSFTDDRVSTLGCRYRKAAFHYILAGHRYNRCGLKHFALFCYRRYNYPNWEAASDHVNLTVARLFLSIASTNNFRKQAEYYQKGLEILRKFSHKQLFFNEFLRELKKMSNNWPIDSNDTVQQLQQVQSSNLYVLDIPYIDRIEFKSPDSIQLGEKSPLVPRKLIRTTCFVGEEVHIQLIIIVPFELVISNISLIPDKPDHITPVVHIEPITIRPNEKNLLDLKFIANFESEFSFIGLSYQIDGLNFKNLFKQKTQNLLAFVSIHGLPLIMFNVHFNELQFGIRECPIEKLLTTNRINIPKKVYGSEILTFGITFETNVSHNELNLIQLSTNTKDFYEWNLNESNDERFEAHYIIKDLNQPLNLSMQIPPNINEHIVYFKLSYQSPDGRNRTVIRELYFEVIPCIEIEMFLFDQVITLHNLSQTESLAIYDVTVGDENSSIMPLNHSDSNCVLIPINLSAHLLIQKSSIQWVLYGNNIQENNRHGKINLILSSLSIQV
ncbi:trafficking protein particle complex subunit 8 homolog l(3)76BDm [Dermatophagoides pteronyssinus]|uniref:Trafficking protein particle complex subunit 8-like n=1 Tax=Dermatophagoides pteronyssinus TaxID=6956 RepID=A0A6P6YFL6_DERPT|nr:trafficking protein particle complex subunit 8-like [Dermatophagoides pteronyssinus]